MATVTAVMILLTMVQPAVVYAMVIHSTSGVCPSTQQWFQVSNIAISLDISLLFLNPVLHFLLDIFYKYQIWVKILLNKSVIIVLHS